MGLFDKLGGAVSGAMGDGGIGKVTDLVNDLWDKRDDIISAIGWVKDHGDDLVNFMQKLPSMLGEVGGSMDTAGKAAHTASNFLVGTAEAGGSSVQELMGLAASALGRAQDQIGSTAQTLLQLGSQFDNVPLLGQPAAKVREGAGFIVSMTSELAEIGQKLAELGSRLGDVGHNLNDVGDGLSRSGSTLRGFAGLAD